MAKNTNNNASMLSQEMIDNIENYADDITTITDDMTAVRTRPGMYIGPRGAAGFLNMIREVFQNSMDQMVSPKSPCDLVKVVYDMRSGGIVTISDNGLGIPFDDIVRVYTKLHTSKNYKKDKGDYSAGLNGVGAKATNALSKQFIVTSYKYTGEAKQVIFEKGIPKKEKMISNKECRQGTEVTFTPDKDIMGNTRLDSGILYLLIRDMLSLTAIGNKVDYTSISESGKVYQELMVNENGILTNLIGKVQSMVIPPIIISVDTGEMKLDCAFTFDASSMDGENITAFANMCPTSTVPSNTHVKGFIDGVCSWFIKYMNNIYLNEKSKIKVNSNDVKAGLAAMISAFHLNPDFTGQAKEVFSNADYEPFAKQCVITALDGWAKDRPQELQKVGKFIKDVAEVRMKADSEKVKITAKYERSATSGLPSKYKKPSGPASEGWELLIVEGDSAESSASQGRDVRRQGIFPIRGKILNVFDATPDKIMGNAEIMGIKDILGAGFGKTFDISKVKFKKVIFLTDADADGAHIASLLLLVFIKCFPGMIEAGMVYKAVPPLYGISKGIDNKTKKDKMVYFTERVDFARYMQKQFVNKHTVCDETGKALTPVRFTNIILNNEDYVYEMDTICNIYKIDPNLLEILLVSRENKLSYAKLRKTLVSAYRFLREEDIVKSGDTIKIKGLIGEGANESVQTIFYNERFLQDCHNVFPFISNAISDNAIRFILDGAKVGLYQLMHSIEKSMNVGLYRYKGLGEMEGEQLGESTLLPDNRMLIRYTTDDIKHDIQIIRQHESDKKLILANIGSVNRIDLIG